MIKINKIRKIVINLKNKYQTSDPFELANALKISVFFEELGTINGYYNKPLRMKQIHINDSLDQQDAKFTCAHELGHAILHPTASTPFLRSKTMFSVAKMEVEANAFAAHLLITDEEIIENIDHTTEQFSRIIGYSENLIKLRLKTFELKNYLPEPITEIK